MQLKAAGVLMLLALVAATLGALLVQAASEAVWSSSSSGFKRFIIYYGWLNTSNLDSLDLDVVVVSGTSRIFPGGDDYPVLYSLRQRGVEVFAYLHDSSDNPVGLGSSFKRMVVDNTTGSLEERYSYWLGWLESLVDRYVGVVDGVFLDECDPAFFTSDLDSELVDYFTWGIGNLSEYARSKGLKVFINGVMGYAVYADYYLWEEFVDSYDWSTGRYYLLDSFLRSTSYSSPLEWVNGLSRYEYLRDHGLLERTLALSFYDPRQPETRDWARLGHALARIMGLAGWGYVNATAYSYGGPVPTNIPVYEYGPPVSSPVIDEVSQTAWRMFAAAGNVTVNYTSATLHEEPVYNTLQPIVDGDGSEYSNLLSSTSTGSYSELESVGMLYTVKGLYLYAAWRYTSSASTGGLLHVYIDSDGDSSTGFQVYGIGADYLVEVYTDGSAVLYSYQGSGSEWSWSELGPVEAAVTSDGLSYTTEMLVPDVGLTVGSSKIEVAVVYNWNDDATAGPYQVDQIYVVQPSFYEEADGLEAYTGVVLSLSIGSSSARLVADGPSGGLVNYTLVLPFTSVSGVEVNGTPLPETGPEAVDSEGYYWSSLGGGYVLVTVVARHGSPVEIVVYSEPLPVPEKGLAAAAAAAAALLILEARRRR